MTTAAKSGIRNVDRFWRNVEQHAEGEHLYVDLLGLRTYETVDLHSRIEEGLSYDSLERLQQVLEVPISELGRFVRISPRTLARRKEVGRLQPDESDQLLRLSRLVGLALQLFEGSLEEARSWLQTPNLALGGGSPLGFATTDVGARAVEQLIGRLEHGVGL
jgi:putative toxin-antitoxin system antitoxin component (TIGR02293 family)